MAKRISLIHAERTGADAVLFTCSAFGPCIETARRIVGIPVLKPNEAMIDAALDAGRRLALVASFAPTLPSMQAEFEEAAAARGIRLELSLHAVPDAMPALQAGDAATHDRLIAETAAAVAGVTKARVLTSPTSAVERLRGLLA